MDFVQAITEVERLQAAVMRENWQMPTGCGLSVYVKGGEYNVTAHYPEKGGQHKWCNITLRPLMREKAINRKIDRLQRFLGV